MTLEEAIAALKAAQSKIDSLETELKKHADAKNEAQVAELRKQLDAAQGELDKAKADATRLQAEKDAKTRTDADVSAKVRVIDGARLLHGKADAVDVGQSSREIMVAALVSRDSNFKADGKSDEYVAAWFDKAVEDQKKAGASFDAYRGAMRDDATTVATMQRDGSPMGQIVAEFDGAILANRAMMTNAWRGKDAAEKAAEKARTDAREGRARVAPLMQQFDSHDLAQRYISVVGQMMPRALLDMFVRMEGNIRRDSDPATAFFQRQLLYIVLKPYEFIYAEIKYASLFPVTYEVPTGARSYAFHQYDDLGAADIIDDYADDAPNADVVGREMIGKIFPVRSEFSISLQDIRSAMMAGIPLEAMKAVRARRIIERKCDALAATGDANRSMKGAANDGNATTVTLTTKGAGGTTWLASGVPNATPNEVLNDVNLMYNKILTATGGDVEADTLYVGKNAWGYLQTTRLDNFNQTTVGDYLRTKLGWLKRIEYWPRLNTAGSGSVERIMMTAISPEYFQFVIPQEFEQLPPQPINMAWKTPCHKRWAEPQMIQPKTFAYADNSSS